MKTLERRLERLERTVREISLPSNDRRNGGSNIQQSAIRPSALTGGVMRTDQSSSLLALADGAAQGLKIEHQKVRKTKRAVTVITFTLVAVIGTDLATANYQAKAIANEVRQMLQEMKIAPMLKAEPKSAMPGKVGIAPRAPQYEIGIDWIDGTIGKTAIVAEIGQEPTIHGDISHREIEPREAVASIGIRKHEGDAIARHGILAKEIAIAHEIQISIQNEIAKEARDPIASPQAIDHNSRIEIFSIQDAAYAHGLVNYKQAKINERSIEPATGAAA